MSRPTLQRVFVRGLRVQAAIGVHPHEHGRMQPLIVDADLDVEIDEDDELAATVNYETVVAAAHEVLGGGHVQLVETFARRVADICLGRQRVQRVRVRVEKPEAIADAAAAGFEVVVER